MVHNISGWLTMDVKSEKVSKLLNHFWTIDREERANKNVRSLD